jgi:hypothetical protein
MKIVFKVSSLVWVLFVLHMPGGRARRSQQSARGATFLMQIVLSRLASSHLFRLSSHRGLERTPRPRLTS